MKNLFILIVALLFSLHLKAQNQLVVIESYIIDLKIEKQLASEILSNKEFLTVLRDSYFNITIEDAISDEKLENYWIVKNEFDIKHPLLSTSKKYKFLLNHKPKENNWIYFSNVLFSKYHNYAIFYVKEKGKGVSDKGELILMELKDGEWQYKSTLYAWRE